MKNKEKYNLTELAVMSDLKNNDYSVVELEVFDSKDNRVYKTEIDLENNKASLIQDAVMDYYNKWLEAEYVEPIRLTRNEKAILESLEDYWKYVARDEYGELMIYTGEPKKGDYRFTSKEPYRNISFFNHLFQFIKWEDEEPYSIEELLKCEVVDDEDCK